MAYLVTVLLLCDKLLCLRYDYFCMHTYNIGMFVTYLIIHVQLSRYHSNWLELVTILTTLSCCRLICLDLDSRALLPHAPNSYNVNLNLKYYFSN